MTLNRNHVWAVIHINKYKQNNKISIYTWLQEVPLGKMQIYLCLTTYCVCTNRGTLRINVSYVYYITVSIIHVYVSIFFHCIVL